MEGLLLIIGFTGILGHLLDSHVLKSYWPGAAEEISLPGSIGVFLLGIVFYLLIERREQLETSRRLRTVYQGVIVFLLAVGTWYTNAYLNATGFNLINALLYSYPPLSLTFVATLKCILLALCMIGLLYWPRKSITTYGAGSTALLFLGIDLYATGGHVFNVPILFNYKTSFPGIIASVLIGIGLLYTTIPTGGLLAPLYSHLAWVRRTAMFSLGLSTLLVFGGVLLSGRLEQLLPPSSHKSMVTYLVLEYGTIALASLITLLSLRTIHFCGWAHDAERRLHKLNTELEQRVTARTAELEDVVLQLENINREQKAYSYMVSYDLHAPLRIIAGFIGMLRDSATERLSDYELDLLNRMNNRCQRLRLLVDELLELSSVTHFRLRMEEVDLTLLARSIILELREQEPDRKVEVIIQPELRMVGDYRLLTLILKSLLQNAWKYTGRNPEAAIEFGCKNIQGEPTYYVRDNGVGFDMKETHKLFHPFETLHHRSEFKGAGIGLAIAARAVERYQGTIWGVGKVNEGATFYFQLMNTPKPQKPSRETIGVNPPAPAITPGMR